MCLSEKSKLDFSEAFIPYKELTQHCYALTRRAHVYVD